MLSCKIGYEILYIGRLEPGVALAAGLLLVGEDTDTSIFRHTAVKQRRQRRIGADPVVMAICAYKTAVKADIRRFEGRHHGELRREEVRLGDAVFLIEQVEYVDFDKLACLIVTERQAAHKHIKALAGNGFGHGFFHLILCEVGQQVGDAELRVALVLAKPDSQFSAVLFNDYAMQCKGNGRPLIFFDAAVIVGLELD